MSMRQSALKNLDRPKFEETSTRGPLLDLKRQPEVRVPEEAPRIPNEGYMRLPAVLSVFPVSKSSWWAGISTGRFPKGVKLGPRITAWGVEDIWKLIERPY